MHFHTFECMHFSYSKPYILVHTFHSPTIIFIIFFFLLQTKEMHEAVTCQIKAELRSKEKETRILFEEAQQEYDSQSAYHFHYLHLSKLIFIHSILSLFIMRLSPSLFQTFPLGKHSTF